MADLLNDTLTLQIDQSTTSDGSIDTETIDQDTDGDEFVGGDFFHEFVESGLVHDDGVFSLLLGLSLGPLLLLSLGTSACRFSRSLLIDITRNIRIYEYTNIRYY